MKYYIFTYGCQMNESDSERISSLLKEQGYNRAKNEMEADLIVINACSVRQSAIDRVYSKINKYSKNKKVILTGCLLEADKNKLKEKITEFWHPDKYFRCSPIHQSNCAAYIPIMTGCNNFCSYCVVPYTRGREKSRPAEEIIKEVIPLIKNGYKEIVLIGQNVNSYQSKAQNSKLINFPKLLKAINDLPGDFRLTFLTSHPKDMSDELIDVIANGEKIIKEIHLPIQSGDNAILRKMNRHYTAGHYKNLVQKIRRRIPEAKISTDIIVGFPGETKKQFQNTVKLCRQIKFNMAYIAKYSPRAGTAAAKLKDDISPQEKKRRWQILEALINKPNFKKAKRM